jgi:hypothetical protein
MENVYTNEEIVLVGSNDEEESIDEKSSYARDS